MRISDWSSDVCSSDLDFPMPPNLVITDGQFTEGSHAVQANFLVRGTSAESVNQVWGFFNDRLPEAGYEIQQFQPLDAGATQALVYFNGDRFKDCSVQLSSTDGGTSVLINLQRSEERRVGQECVSPFRFRGSPYH